MRAGEIGVANHLVLPVRGETVATRGLFRGHALQAIDAKGRVAIPASLRATIERNGSDRVMLLDVHAGDPCLTGADVNLGQLDYERLREMESRVLDTGRAADANYRAFATSEDVPYDSSGRFILPPVYRDHAGLTDVAFFLGAGERFEIWNPHTLLDAPNIPDAVKTLARHHLAQRSAA